jgi:hypothetical protein
VALNLQVGLGVPLLWEGENTFFLPFALFIWICFFENFSKKQLVSTQKTERPKSPNLQLG